MKKAGKIILKILATAVVVFLLVFFLYDSPAKFEPSTYGYMADSATGEPFVYYEELFGRSFVKEDGKWRTYCVVPSSSENSVENQYVCSERLEDAVSAKNAGR